MRPEKIMCSAVWVKDKVLRMTHTPKNIDYGVVFCGYRHCDCLEVMSLIYTRKQGVEFGTIQGFLTTNKRFVDRVEARIIAESCGQILDSKYTSHGKELYSEDVWMINYEGE